jgi:Domain of Unknown Function with PDB structure (DUF3857)/Transglutaminase-like superfamily/Domain of Unknown Function with PDB structure (DUF3858)
MVFRVMTKNSGKRRTARFSAGVMVLAGLLTAGQARAEPAVHARIDRDIAVYQVNRDLTYTRTETIDATLHTSRAVRHLDRASETFYPEKQSLDVAEAWVDQPDGQRIAVEPAGIFTRPSSASRSAPGFVNSLTTTVLFPRLTPGSRTHVVWRFTQKVPPLLGLNILDQNIPDWETGRDEVRIELPADVPLHWRARGGFTVEDRTEDGVRHIDAYIEGTQPRAEEPASVSHSDYMPLFVATTLPNAEAIGATIDRASEGKATVTPEIAALAERLAEDKTGLDAARAIHAWVVANIRYVAVRLDPDDGFVPHAAGEVLNNGYGDCKDYVTLMRALLAARGIEARMAVIDWGSRYAEPLSPSPFFFNHAILYLPAYDRFVNPTDRMANFDSLDRALSGKDVVIISKEGAVARTPPATPEANRYRYVARSTLGADGAIDGTASYTMSPNEEIGARNAVSGASSLTEMAERVLANTPEGGFGGFTSSDPLDLSQPLALRGTWHSAMAANVQDHEIFLRVPAGLDLFPPWRERAKLTPAGQRRSPEVADVIDAGWENTIALQPGTRVARLPPNVDVVTSVGRYTARYREENGAVLVSRNLVIERQVVEPEAYPEFERMLYAALVDARAVIVLTNLTQ